MTESLDRPQELSAPSCPHAGGCIPGEGPCLDGCTCACNIRVLGRILGFIIGFLGGPALGVLLDRHPRGKRRVFWAAVAVVHAAFAVAMIALVAAWMVSAVLAQAHFSAAKIRWGW